jgi:hypothetical protein
MLPQYTLCIQNQSEKHKEKHDGYSEHGIYFLRFLDISAIEPNALVAPIQPPPKGNGELINVDSSHDPIPSQPAPSYPLKL